MESIASPYRATRDAGKEQWVTAQLDRLDRHHLGPLARLLARLSKKELAYCSQAWLAEQLGRTVRTVQRQLDELEALGLLVRFVNQPRQRPDGRWYRKTNRYGIPFRRRVVKAKESQRSPRRHQRRQKPNSQYKAALQEPAFVDQVSVEERKRISKRGFALARAALS